MCIPSADRIVLAAEMLMIIAQPMMNCSLHFTPAFSLASSLCMYVFAQSPSQSQLILSMPMQIAKANASRIVIVIVIVIAIL